MGIRNAKCEIRNLLLTLQNMSTKENEQITPADDEYCRLRELGEEQGENKKPDEEKIVEGDEVNSAAQIETARVMRDLLSGV
jgi:hypothetical protein